MPPVTGEEPSPLAGLLLAGRYRLDSLIAAGGMGEVWSATDELLGRPVAVKLIKDVHAADEAFLDRFRAEARFAAALSHPGVAQVFDYGEQTESPPRGPYLVMELVAGRQLSALITQVGALPTGVVLEITGQAARALNAAHRLGITHRDVKPANLLITDDGQVKITDFGIAGAAQSSTAGGATEAGLVMGTAAYMSPEQARGRPVTPASDIYSLGIVAYQCVAGRLPFTAETALALALAHAETEPRPLPTGIPGPVRDLIMAMIAKDPQRRPASARDVAEMAGQLRIELLPGGGPQLADVAAWVAAGIGDPVTSTDSPGTTVAQPAVRAGRSSALPRRRALLAGAVTCVAAGGAAALIATMLLTGSPAAVTGPTPRHRPVAQAPTPTPHATAHRKPSPTQAPLVDQVGTSQSAQPTRSASPSAPPSTPSTPPRTHSPSPSPSPSQTPTSPGPTPTP